MRFFIKNICLPVVIFWLDLAQFFLFKTIYVHCMLITYWHRFFTYSSPYYILLFVFIIIESWYRYSSSLFPSLYLVPLTMASFQVKRQVYPSPLFPACMLALSIALEAFFAQFLFHQSPLDIPWTIAIFLGNILLIVLISLKKTIHTKQGNRS